MKSHVHVIAVDASQTAEEAWLELCIFGFRTTYTTNTADKWATMRCDSEECRLIQKVTT